MIKRTILIALVCVTITGKSYANWPVFDANGYSALVAIEGAILSVNATLLLILAAEEMTGQAIESGHKQIQGAITKGFEWHIKEMRNLMMGQIAAEKKMDSFKANGTPGKTPFVCCDEDSKMEIAIGHDRINKTVASIRENIAQFNNEFATRKNSMDAIRNIPDVVTNAENIFPTGNTLSNKEEAGSLKNAVMMSYLITNPYPSLTIDDDLKETTHGKEYLAAKKVIDANISLPQMAMSEIIANKTASYDLGVWATQMHKSMGKDKAVQPTGVIEGKISADALLDTLTAIRYANPNWSLDIHTKSTEGLLRELLIMDSVTMEFMRRQTKLMQNMLAMMAQSGSLKIASMNDELKALRIKALEETLRKGSTE